MLRDTGMETLLGVTVPGSLVMVIGRPGAGVSTTLFKAVTRWTNDGKPAVLASWERPASGLREQLTTEHVKVFDILGWTIDEFETRVQAAALPAGTLIAVDYLQLIGSAGDVSRRLAEIGQRAGIAVLLGAMAPRTLHPVLNDGASAAKVLRSPAGALDAMRGADARAVHRLVGLVEGHHHRRELVISHPAPNLRMLQATVGLD